MSKVLLIEDDLILLEMYTHKFAHEGFEVETATDGQDGIAKMKTFKPDVVLLDLIIPQLSGFEVLKVVKDDPVLSKIPIIVLTNIFADAEDLVKNWGVQDFLLKAKCTPQDVFDKVTNLLP